MSIDQAFPSTRQHSRVDELCKVKLIKLPETGRYEPRLKFLKRDTSKTHARRVAEVDATTAKIDGRFVKASVDLERCHEAVWLRIGFLQYFDEIDLLAHEIRFATGDQATLLASLEGHNKPAILQAVATQLRGELTEADVLMLIDRRATLELFEKMLDSGPVWESERERRGGPERAWQHFFEQNPWIFGYGLTLVACDGLMPDRKMEQATSGADVFGGAGKRSDAILRTRSAVQSLLFCEIKHHEVSLVKELPYREPDVYVVDDEIRGAVAQVRKTVHKAMLPLTRNLEPIKTPGGSFLFEVSTLRPKQVVVVGRLSSLADDGGTNSEMLASFELYRRGEMDVEILTFDELYERARFIVETGRVPAGTPASQSWPGGASLTTSRSLWRSCFQIMSSLVPAQSATATSLHRRSAH